MKYHVSTILVTFALAAAWPLAAQTAAPVDAVTLAKYDKNNNGRLDPEELAEMNASEKSTVVLSAFEVRTDLDLSLIHI